MRNNYAKRLRMQVFLGDFFLGGFFSWGIKNSRE